MSHSLALSRTQSVSLSLSLSLTHSFYQSHPLLPNKHSLSLTPCLSLPHTHTHTLSLSHTHTLSLSLSLTHTLFLSPANLVVELIIGTSVVVLYGIISPCSVSEYRWDRPSEGYNSRQFYRENKNK